MNKIYNNLNIDNLMRTEWINQFDEDQKFMIEIGFERNVNVSIYAKTEFSWKQMKEIMLGLIKNLDVSFFAEKEFTWE